MISPEKQDTCDFCDPHGNTTRGLSVGNLRGILPLRSWLCGRGGRAQEQGWECLRSHVTVWCISGQWHSLSLALSLSLTHKRLFNHVLTQFPIIHPPTHSFFNSFTLFLSLSVSGVYVRGCARACPSLLLSLTFTLAFSLRPSVCLSLSSLHMHSRTRSHTLSLSHSLTNAHTH